MSVLQIAISLIVSGGVAALMIPLMIRIGYHYRMLDMPGQHKRHKKPTPILGGPALFFSTWITVGLMVLIFQEDYAELGGAILYILSGALVITLVGLADDFSPLTAWAKLAAQVGAGLLLYLGGLRVEFISTPMGSLEIGSLSVLITVLWVVMLTNAINLIDGLDGLAAGVSLIGGIILIVIGLFYQVGSVLVFLTVLCGFLIVFLRFNWHPAKIFLGDSGSMQIGYYFAVFSLIFPLKSYTISALYLPLLVLGVPILETISSASRRFISGKNIMGADRRHLFHYLSLMGFSPRQILSIFYFMAFVFGLAALAMFFWDRLIVFGYLVFFMVVIFALFFILITNVSPKKRDTASGGGNNGAMKRFRSRLR
ncbi:MAG: MraY family glycosyltransferase [bacterium]|nr:MraY family glycosyltransferase [bacterium]